MLLATAIFLVALALIAAEWGHRTKIAMAGAVIVVIAGTLDQAEAIEAIDWETIGLLAGMMIVVRVTEPTGVYNYVAIKAGQLARGRSLPTMLALAGTTALLSAFLDNLTTVLLMVPITFLLADALDVDPIPLVIIEVIASNIGGTATLIGDPPNILIAGHTGLGFGAFLANLAPVAIVTLAVVLAVLYVFMRRSLRIDPAARTSLMELDARASIEDPVELRRTLPVLVLTIVAFFLHGPLGLEPATVALAGAALILLVTRQDLERSLAGIEWATLFFFVGLFVLVGALEHSGAIGAAADAVAALTAGDRSAELLGILWGSAAGSAVVDNIPFTTAMLPVVDQLGGLEDDAYWWALALGACFGGNATIIAAAANVAAAGMVERAGGKISFIRFARVGLPVTALSIAIATGYLWLRYLQ